MILSVAPVCALSFLFVFSVGFSMKRAVAVVEEAAENNGSGSTVLCTMTVVYGYCFTVPEDRNLVKRCHWSIFPTCCPFPHLRSRTVHGLHILLSR